MKILIGTALVLSCAYAGAAVAGCGATERVSGSNLTGLLQAGTLICGRPITYGGSPNDRWQEEHRGGGELWDYKKGPTDKVDPSKRVGSWAVNTTSNTVTHSYTGGPSYTWTVHLVSGSTYSFCTSEGGAEVVRAFVGPGVGPCASYP